jgi:hypothetical protein
MLPAVVVTGSGENDISTPGGKPAATRFTCPANDPVD